MSDKHRFYCLWFCSTVANNCPGAITTTQILFIVHKSICSCVCVCSRCVCVLAGAFAQICWSYVKRDLHVKFMIITTAVRYCFCCHPTGRLVGIVLLFGFDYICYLFHFCTNIRQFSHILRLKVCKYVFINEIYMQHVSFQSRARVYMCGVVYNVACHPIKWQIHQPMEFTRIHIHVFS